MPFGAGLAIVAHMPYHTIPYSSRAIRRPTYLPRHLIVYLLLPSFPLQFVSIWIYPNSLPMQLGRLGVPSFT